MAEPIIDKGKQLRNNSQINLRPFLIGGIPVAVLFLSLMLSFFQGCTDLGHASRDKWYDATASTDSLEGFVGKSNQLLSELLKITDAAVPATCLDSLNKRYPALEFALPYSEENKELIDASDLRLVDIHPEYIEENALRRFYFNSRLPQLLRQQDTYRGETYFRIRCKGVAQSERNVRPIEVTSISLIPSMFKVALSKSPWTGVITGVHNCLFPDSNSIFLTYGNTVLPLRNERRLSQENTLPFIAIMRDGTLRTPRGPINYYDYYQSAYKSTDLHSVQIELREQMQGHALASFILSYSNDTLRVTHSSDLIVVGDGEAKAYPAAQKGSQRPDKFPFKDGMKLLVYNHESMKLGEFTLQRHDPSTLLSSLVQSSTGTSRFIISDSQTDLFTQQMLRGLSRHLSNRDNIKQVELSIDPLLSKEFEQEIRSYLKKLQKDIADAPKRPKSQTKEQYDMSVTIMDLATGDVLATPFHTTQFEPADYPDVLRMTTRNPSLARRSIGSTFKPMLALAAVQTTPSLLDMDTQNPHRYSWDGTSETVNFFGRTTKVWAKNSTGHWGGCDFTSFLSRSDDVYPVALASLAMTEVNVGSDVTTLPLTGEKNYFELDRKGMLKLRSDTLHLHSDPRYHLFTDWLSYLYDINYEKEYSTDLDLFSLLFNDRLDSEQRAFGLEEISPDITSLRMDRFGEGGDFRQALVPWVLGQGDNMWNCIKVAEAWSRLVSKRAVSASFIKHHGDSASVSLIQGGDDYPGSTSGALSVARKNTIWNTFLEKLHSAQSGGSLLGPMRNNVVRLNQAEGVQLTLFSKTGTPDAYTRYENAILGGSRRYVDVGMYTFTLMDNAEYERHVKLNQPSRGITCVVRITRSYECAKCRPGHQCKACKQFWGLKSAHARNFFSDESSNRLKKLYEMTRDYY